MISVCRAYFFMRNSFHCTPELKLCRRHPSPPFPLRNVFKVPLRNLIAVFLSIPCFRFNERGFSVRYTSLIQRVLRPFTCVEHVKRVVLEIYWADFFLLLLVLREGASIFEPLFSLLLAPGGVRENRSMAYSQSGVRPKKRKQVGIGMRPLHSKKPHLSSKEHARNSYVNESRFI